MPNYMSLHFGEDEKDKRYKVRKDSPKDLQRILEEAFRDVDLRNGIVRCDWEKTESDIDMSKTHNNKTYVYDDTVGEYVRATSIDQAYNHLESNMEQVTGRVQCNSIVMRVGVIQISPEWYEGKSQEECDKIDGVMMDFILTEFNNQGDDIKNVIYMSAHKDESSPHIQFGMNPLTSEGRLRQNEWFNGKTAIGKFHDRLRKHMIDNGYDVEIDNKIVRDNAEKQSNMEHVGVADFKSSQDLVKANDELRIKTSAMQSYQAQADAIKELQADLLQVKQDIAELAPKVQKIKEFLEPKMKEGKAKDYLMGELDALLPSVPDVPMLKSLEEIEDEEREKLEKQKAENIKLHNEEIKSKNEKYDKHKADHVAKTGKVAGAGKSFLQDAKIDDSVGSLLDANGIYKKDSNGMIDLLK